VIHDVLADRFSATSRAFQSHTAQNERFGAVILQLLGHVFLGCLDAIDLTYASEVMASGQVRICQWNGVGLDVAQEVLLDCLPVSTNLDSNDIFAVVLNAKAAKTFCNLRGR